jgi:poly-gamma-glutamate synthesis protein (capsule biosynthesis protein)
MTEKEHSCRLLAVGDIMLHGKIAAKIAETNDPLYPFRKIIDTLKDKDILFGNMETMITRDNKPYPGTPAKYFSPPGTARALKETGFDIVNLGHNHLFDWGAEGVETTMKELQNAGIAYAGVGRNYQDAARPAIVTCKTCGRRFGFLCYTATYNTLDKSHSYVGRPPKQEYLRQDIAALQKHADTIIVSIHGGACLNPWPSPEMLNSCRRAIDTGAHIVLGHHAHVMNGIEPYRGGLIAYALPDFVRPLPLDSDEVANGQKIARIESLVLSVCVTGRNEFSSKILPCILDFSLQTWSADETNTEAIKKRVENLSSDIAQGKSSQKHMELATSNFHGIYTASLLREFRRGGIRWFWKRLRTASPYHWSILLSGLLGKLLRKKEMPLKVL